MAVGSPLPEHAITRGGHAYFPERDVWRINSIRRSIIYNFNIAKNVLSDSTIMSFKRVMVWYLSEYSADHATNVFFRFNAFLRFLAETYDDVSEITSAQILSYRSHLPTSKQWYLGVISGFMKQWHEMGFTGVQSDVPRLFDALRIKGNAKGVAVRTMDPTTGPFDDMELQSIHEALNDAYAKGAVKTEDFLLVRLFAALGVRPVQIAAMKCKDLMVGRDEDGLPTYILNVPRAKLRGREIRSSMKPRLIVREIGEILEAWICHLQKTNPVDAICAGDLPIFPRWWSTVVTGYEHHNSSDAIRRRVNSICNSLNVLSSRTGERLKVSSRRFRYTLGTRAAEEGHGELVIAELLDHSDTQNVAVYVEANPAIAERIDKATALELAPIAQAFCGMIVENEERADRGDDLTSRIGSPSIGHVGTCGKFGFCGGRAPIACYTCRNFQPWVDAPHEELLDHLIQERNRLLDTTGDERIASTNDRAIMAVADVTTQCRAMRE